MANQLRHVAIIMDGNGRWARSRGLERFLGHRKGTQATIDAVEVGVNLKLEHMTLYVFSSENWGRPSKEVDYLMNLLIEMVVKEIPDLMEKNVKLTVIGNMNRLPEKPRTSLQSAIDKTANNTGMQLNLAISYGGRQEIVEATGSRDSYRGRVQAFELPALAGRLQRILRNRYAVARLYQGRILEGRRVLQYSRKTFWKGVA